MKSHHYQKPKIRFRLFRYGNGLPSDLFSKMPIPAKEEGKIIGYWVCQ